jgi:hypothetical protein
MSSRTPHGWLFSAGDQQPRTSHLHLVLSLATNCDGSQLDVFKIKKFAMVACNSALPQSSKHLHSLVGPNTPLTQRHTKRFELGRKFSPDAQADRDSSSRSGVEISQLLCDKNGVVQREE